MAQRVAVGNPFENQIGTVGPTAAPVDTYVKPVVERSNLAALADALGSIEKAYVPALAKVEKRAAEREFAEGQRLYEENRIAMGEAVKQGIIQPGESPYVRKGYRLSQMTTMATRYADDLERALETKKLYHSGDPTKIEEFIQSFQQDFIQKNGMADFNPAEVSQYFGQPANKANEAFRGAWQKKHVAWQADQAYKAFETEVATTVSTLFPAGQTPEEYQTSLGELSKYLENRATGMATDGLDNKRVLGTIMSAMSLVVEQTGDDDVLDVFAQTKFGTDYASKSLTMQTEIMKLRGRALTLQSQRQSAQEKAINKAYSNARAAARATLVDFELDPSPENRAAVMEAITTLRGTNHEESVMEASQLLDGLQDYDKDWKAELRSVARIDDAMTDISTMTDENQVRALLRTYGDAGYINIADYSDLLQQWRKNYDPSNDVDLGLKLFSSTSPEGRIGQEIRREIEGNEFSLDLESAAKASDFGAKYRSSLRARVKSYKDKNGRNPQPYEIEAMAIEIRDLLRHQYNADPLAPN